MTAHASKEHAPLIARENWKLDWHEITMSALEELELEDS